MKLRIVTLVIATFLPIAVWGQPSSQPVPTFNKDVMPILQEHCQGCHRPGEIGPMSLLSYDDARPWARSIRNNVSKRVMPPWFADPSVGKYSNDRRLSDSEIQTIVRWVDGGAPRGNPADLPKEKTFVEGWNIGKPDVILTMQAEQRIPASGIDEYIYFAVPTNFDEDRFIQAIEIRPGNRRIVHHVLAYVRKGGTPVPVRSNTEAINQRAGVNFFKAEGAALRVNDDAPVYNDTCNLPNGGAIMPAGAPLWGFAPGTPPLITSEGTALKIPAKSDILLQIHYTKTGKEEVDRTSVGLVFAKTPPKKLLETQWVMNQYFQIPPNASNHEAKSCYTFNRDVDIFSFLPHMHMRGKDMEFKAFYPDGRSEVVFRVPSYDFNWQLTYILQTPLHLPRGTRIEVTAHYDNSVARKGNPNPNAAVRWGDPTTDEMLIGEMYYVPTDPPKPGSK
jgi:hypothetical protein